MTARLKQPYSKPLFKKFFLQTCTMRNFGNTKRWILEELQTSFKNKAIINLSAHQISLTETEGLTLGLNFVPTPQVSTHHLVLKSTNRLIQTIKKQLHFRNQPLIIKRPTYRKPSTWIPREPNSTNLTLFLERTQSLIRNLPLRHKMQSRLIAKVHH